MSLFEGYGSSGSQYNNHINSHILSVSHGLLAELSTLNIVFVTLCAVILPIVQMRKLNEREVKYLPQGVSGRTKI